MHHNKPNITYLLTWFVGVSFSLAIEDIKGWQWVKNIVVPSFYSQHQAIIWTNVTNVDLSSN